MSTKTATPIRRLSGWQGKATLYKLSEQLEGNTHVIVSAVDLSSRYMRHPDDTTPNYMLIETDIFAATEDGEVADWMELPGSQKGTLDHAEALRGAGYEVAA
jgi:hypothetical protein